MPRIAQRQIPIFYKPPHVSVMEIDKVILYYNNGVPISDIIRRCQVTKQERDGKCLSYPDVYTILFHAIKDARVKQRVLPAGELPIRAFPEYFQGFRNGCTFDECWHMLGEDDQKVTSKHFHTRLFRAMGDRFREYQKKQTDVLDKLDSEQRERKMASVMFTKFKRLSIGAPGRGRPAIVLFLDELPLEFLNQLHQLNTDFSKEMLLALNPTMLSEMDAHEVRHKVKNREPKLLSKSMQQKLADEAVKELELSLGNETPSSKSHPIDPEDEAELNILTPEKLGRLDEEVTEPQLSMQLPSGHQPPSQSPGYDLNNMIDDDPLEPDEDSPHSVE